MTATLDNFVTGVVDDANKNARANLVTALSSRDAWVADYVAKLTDDETTTTTRAALVDQIKDAVSKGKTVTDLLTALKEIIVAALKDVIIETLSHDDQDLTKGYVAALLAVDAKTRTALSTLISGKPPAGLDELIKTLTSHDDVRNEWASFLGNDKDKWMPSYVNILVAPDPGGGQWTAQADHLAKEIDDRNAVPADMDRPLKALVAKTHVKEELIKLLTPELATNGTFLGNYAAGLKTDKPTRDALAGALETVAAASAGSLKPLIEALAGQTHVRDEIAATLKDAGHDDWLAAFVTQVTSDTSITAATLAARKLAPAVVEGNMLEAILLELEKAGSPKSTADLANLIKTSPSGAPLKTALGL
jgi:hypothetical protein